ncbi:hypothetical protein V6N13_132885 [Hibiscus sabdariffa]|uniref:Dof-type domain-containing protein n=1 Tax=Hibiscus sabdariffa TaxID=183260 RepID=A0ABR2PWQ5_9ROSI
MYPMLFAGHRLLTMSGRAASFASFVHMISAIDRNISQDTLFGPVPSTSLAKVFGCVSVFIPMIGQNKHAGSNKCPRCESTNTEFCYFNNYRLISPRHFIPINDQHKHDSLTQSLENLSPGSAKRNMRASQAS